MTLDVRTIVVLLILSSVLMSVTLAVGIRTGRGGAFAKWNVGLALLACGWLLVAARGSGPDLLTHALADAVLLAGLCFQLAAILEFGGTTVPRWLPVAPPALLFAIVLPIVDQYALFTLVVSLAYAAAFVAIAVAAIRLGPSAGPARWMLGAPSIAGAAALVVRAFIMGADPTAYPDLFSRSAVHAAVFLVLFAITAMGSIAFLLMLRERAESEIHRLAMFDPLTELFNRRAFMELAERELARARRDSTPLAVLMLDLDHFKRVNDRFGHQAGDRVLVDFAAVAKRCLRAEDVLGRYGGEEFCAILPGASAGQARAIAERIRLAVAERPLGGLPRATTISVGIAVCAPGLSFTLEAAIARADEALYQAKALGRNRLAALPMDSAGPPLARLAAA